MGSTSTQAPHAGGPPDSDSDDCHCPPLGHNSHHDPSQPRRLASPLRPGLLPLRSGHDKYLARTTSTPGGDGKATALPAAKAGKGVVPSTLFEGTTAAESFDHRVGQADFMAHFTAVPSLRLACVCSARIGSLTSVPPKACVGSAPSRIGCTGDSSRCAVAACMMWHVDILYLRFIEKTFSIFFHKSNCDSESRKEMEPE